MEQITPFLTFQNQAEEAVQFYLSVFPEGRLLQEQRHPNFYGATLDLNGQTVRVLNGGPSFHFSDGFSLFVSCETQQEVDRLWTRLCDGGQEGRCGWLKDRFGVSWQVVPVALGQLFSDPDPARAQRAMQALMKMNKIEIALLQQAADGEETVSQD